MVVAGGASVTGASPVHLYAVMVALVTFLLLVFLHLHLPDLLHLHLSLVPVLPALPLKSIPAGQVKSQTR